MEFDIQGLLYDNGIFINFLVRKKDTGIMYTMKVYRKSVIVMEQLMISVNNSIQYMIEMANDIHFPTFLIVREGIHYVLRGRNFKDIDQQ